jgi:NhaP-type Na+/H+ or K+/H+ antiporter
MIFAQGYTLHKAVFFKNIKNILIFGLLGTFISFLISWGLIYEANQLGKLTNIQN